MPDAPAKIVVDSGPLIALFDAGDDHHARALEFVRETRARLISTGAVLAEVMYVLEDSLPAQRNVLRWIRAGAVALVEPALGDFERIGELIEKYADLPMDFTDAVLVTLCERLGIHHVASVDSDFAIYRFKGRGKFINVFLK